MKHSISLKSLIAVVIIFCSAGLLKSQSFTEKFNDITTLTGNGWYLQNNSTVAGTTNWFQGDSTLFTAFNGASNAYIGANRNNAAGANDISNWLVTPEITIRNGDVISFYTRKVSQDTLADRLQLLMSNSGASTNVGAMGNASDTGDFTTLLIDINPTLIIGVYPLVWTKYTATISGLSAPVSGRFALRYFVTNGGPAGTNADNIGIDNFVYTSVCQPIVITPTSLTDANAGASYSKVFSKTGVFGTSTFSVVSGALPPGLTLSTTGILSGKPTLAGTYNFTIQVTDANGCKGTQTESINIVCTSVPSILSTSANASTVCLGQSSNLNATISLSVQNGFAGFYAPNLWSINIGPDGFINPANAPASVSIVSGDNGNDGATSFSRGVLSTTTNVTITFNWSYSTPDGPSVNYPEYVINGIATVLPGFNTSGSNIQSGTDTITVQAGKTFALAMYTTVAGSGALTVFSNFTGTDPSGTINWYTVSSAGTSIGTSLAGADFSVIPTVVGNNDYYAEAVNIFGCANSSRSQVSVTVNPLPIVTASASTPTLCAGDQVTLTSTGSVATTWNNNVTEGVAFVPPVGTTSYVVTGMDGNGCVNKDSATVLVNPLPAVTANVTSTSLCTGDSLTLSGGGAATYTWDNSYLNGVAFLPVIGPSTYTVTGTDNNGCENTAATSVTVHSLPVVTATASHATICTADSVILSGSGAATYIWDNGVTNNVAFIPSSSGTTNYHVIGTDMYGCKGNDSTSVIVNTNPLPTVIATASASTLCEGNPLTLTSSGAITLVWNNNVTDGVAFVPAVGTTTYQVTGTDANGCVNTASTIVTVNPLPNVTAHASANTLCAGNQLTLTSTGAITRVWDNNVTEGVAFVPPIGTTTYQVTGTNSFGCSNTASTTVIVNPLPTVTANASATSLCTGDSLTLNGGGASTYVWNNFQTNGVIFLPAVGATIYSVIGRDNNGCTNTASALVTVHSLPFITASASHTTICATDSVKLFGGGAATYSWDNGISNNVNFSPAVGRVTYHVIGTDIYGCTGSNSTSVTVNPIPAMAAIASSHSLCTGNQLTLTSTGAVTRVWDNNITEGLAFVPSIGTVTYHVTGTNSFGCVNTATTTVTVNPLPTVTANPTATNLCIGDSLTLYGGGAATYEWIGNHVNGVTFVPAGGSTIYGVIGTDSHGCVNTALTLVTVHSLPIVTATSSHSTICASDSVKLIGGGGATYIWDNGVTNDIAFSASTGTVMYHVIGTDINGCKGTDSTSITVNPQPLVVANATATNFCQGNPLTLTGSGDALSYVWDNNVSDGISFTPIAGTVTYSVRGIGTNGCTNTAIATVTVNPLITIDNYTTICTGDSITVGSHTYHATGDYTDLFQSAITSCDSTVNTHLTVLAPIVYSNTLTLCSGDSLVVGTHTYYTSGIYTDFLVSNTGCDSTLTSNLTVNSPIVASQTISICSGSSIQVGTNVYDTTGVYSDLLRSFNGCDSTLTTNLTVGLRVHTYDTLTICSGDSATVGTFVYHNSGTFTDILVSSIGCDSTVTLHLTVSPRPAIIANSVGICNGQTATITATGAATYIWSSGVTVSGNGTAVANPATTTTYTVTGTSAGCSSTAAVTVSVTATPIVTMAPFTPASICAQNDPFTLPAGTPTGGTYSGLAVNGNTFTPSVNLLGTNFVTYLYSINGCMAAASQSVVVNNCSDVKEFSVTNNIIIYPNPTVGAFTISISNASFDELVINIVDVQGREVYNSTDKVSSVDYIKQLNLEGIAKGIYFIKLSTGKEVNVQKIIVQ